MKIDHRRPGRARRRILALAMFFAVVGTIGAKPYTQGMSFKMRLTMSMPQMPGMNMGDVVIVAHGVAAGSRSRLDVDTMLPPQQAPFAAGDYLLTLDSGRVVAVNPSTKTYVDGFSMAMSSLPPELMSQASITNISVNVEKLGAGEPVEGRPTERYRLVAQVFRRARRE